jgi:hypothetical protein
VVRLDVARFKARQNAYQWRKPCWIVLDALERGLRLFCGPHAEYLEGEPERFFPLEIHHPEGAAESMIG